MRSAAGKGIWYKFRSFINANLINIFAGALFTLLAIFLIYPIISVLVKSLWGDDGFTFDFYVEFFSYNFYYWSFFNTLILGVSTMIILLIVGFQVFTIGLVADLVSANRKILEETIYHVRKQEYKQKDKDSSL